MQYCIRWTEQAGVRGHAATAHYNFGNYLRHIGRERNALHHYRKAAEYDPTYLERGYYWRELGGVVFESGCYRMAVRFYQRAIRLGEEGDCAALLADALMLAGRYRESQEGFEAYITSNPDAESEWRLKAWVLRGVRKMLKLDQQDRQTGAAIKLVPRAMEMSPDDLRRRLMDALRNDALCGLALLIT